MLIDRAGALNSKTMATHQQPGGEQQPSVEELLVGPLREVIEDFRRKWREFQGDEPFWSVLMGFLHAIDWTVRACVC